MTRSLELVRSGAGPAGRQGHLLRLPAWLIDLVVIVGLASSVLLVHDVSYLLGHPYWLDEAWVADSIRAPLHLVPFLTSSTPLGWTLLLRTVPGAGSGQVARLVPLGFCSLAAAAGYGLGVQLRLDRYLTGVLTGLAVLLSPAMLARDDLKQYTAEAFASVTLLWLAAALTTRWSRRRLVGLSACVPVGLLLAPTVVFVGAAVFLGLGIETALKRQWRWFVEVVVAGAAAGVTSGIVYLVAVRPNVIPSLKSYWNALYLPANGSLFSQLHQRLDLLAPQLGFGHPLLALVLGLAGIGALIVLRRYALAVAVPATIALSIAAAMAHAYPFGDSRTSTYWLVMLPVLYAIAASSLVHWLGRSHLPLRAALTCGVAALWVVATSGAVDSHLIPNEGVKGQVSYFASHYRPGDVVVVSEEASYGFAFYDPRIKPSFVPFPVQANGFLPEYPHQPWIIEMHDRSAVGVTRALDQALSEARVTHAHRIWIIRSHLTAAEEGAWSTDLAGKQVRTIPTGPEPLLLDQPS